MMGTSEGIFADIDRMDAKAFASYLSEECVFRFGNTEEIVGRGNIERALSDFYKTIDGLHHHVVETWIVERDTIVQLEVTYERKDGNQATIPVVTIYRSGDNGQIDDYRVFIDLAPVYE